jgi:hypothetical protein
MDRGRDENFFYLCGGEMMITNEQYMDGKASFDDYYAQFHVDSIMRMVNSTYKKQEIRNMLEDGDKHLNGLPNDPYLWDGFIRSIKGEICRVNKSLGNGSCWSYADGVAAIKTYMRKWATP